MGALEQVCGSIPGWFPPPHGYAEVRRTFGDVSVSGDQIVGPTWWEGANLVSVELPGCPHVCYMHKLVVPMAREALRQCVALDDDYEIKKIGWFAPRFKRGHEADGLISMHSWAIAVDINPDDNPMVRIRTPADLVLRKKTIPDAWIECFKSVGFIWGGDFQGLYDPMHFQYASGC